MPRCVFDLLSAAVAAGAVMDATYHPGVWRSVKYTCCDAINKRVAGCKHTTPDVSAPELDASGRNSPVVQSKSSQPVAAAKKRKNVFLPTSVWYTCCINVPRCDTDSITNWCVNYFNRD